MKKKTEKVIDEMLTNRKEIQAILSEFYDDVNCDVPDDPGILVELVNFMLERGDKKELPAPEQPYDVKIHTIMDYSAMESLKVLICSDLCNDFGDTLNKDSFGIMKKTIGCTILAVRDHLLMHEKMDSPGMGKDIAKEIVAEKYERLNKKL